MKIVADEGLDRQIVDGLRADGHDVVYIAELRPGIPDTEIFAEANRDGRLLISADKDFGELVYRNRLITTGIALVRLAGLSPTTKADTVVSAIREHGDTLFAHFSVISPGIIRIRRSTDASWER